MKVAFSKEDVYEGSRVANDSEMTLNTQSRSVLGV